MQQESEVVVPVGGTCERVWDSLTDPGLLAGLDLDVELACAHERLVEGSTLRLGSGTQRVLHRVVEAVPHERLVLSGLLRDGTSHDEVTLQQVGRRVLVRWHLTVRGAVIEPATVTLAGTLQRLFTTLAYPRAPEPPRGAARFRRATA